MMKGAADDDEQLRPTNSSEDVAVGTDAVSSMWRSFAIAIVACVFGILAGVAFHAPRPSPSQPIIPGEGGGYHMHHHFVTEYDLVTIRYETPKAFETDVMGLGVTDKEYKACKSSILQDPNRKICTKPGNKCYMKKLKYEKDSNGDIQPTYVKQGATEVDCPDGGPQVWSNNGFCINGFCKDGRWPAYCRKQLEGSSTAINICYGEITCEEESSQWSTQVADRFGVSCFDGAWTTSGPREINGRFWCAQDAPSWYGGPNPSNLTYPSPSATSTAPYEGKFCLQKAALKALSRRGWELIEPSEAFEAGYGSRGRDLYSSKTFKVIKRTLAM